MLKKHEAFETDFTVHRDRVSDVCANGEDLIKKVVFIERSPKDAAFFKLVLIVVLFSTE